MKKIVILGSTGSIGKSLLKIIKKNKKFFSIKLLTAKKNYKELLLQAKFFNVKNVIISDQICYEQNKEIFKKNKIQIFNNYKHLNKILNEKVDYVMSSIVGIDGLMPTINLIKHTKNIAIANKESIICAWNLIQKQLEKYGTNFVPVDSEHFSIWHALNNNIKSSHVKKIYLTASGGPLLNISNKKFNDLKISQVIRHPNWNMGKKISIDSSNLMNKVFEVIEAKKIFNVNYKQIDILIHPSSYIHAIIEFKNNMISLIAHDTTMEIPISNTLNDINKIYNNDTIHNLNLKKINNIIFKKVNVKKFPLVKILDHLPEKTSLFETVIVAANDHLVNLYLKKKIKYTDITSNLLKLINLDEINKMKNKYPKNVNEVLNLDSYIRTKINKMYI